MSRKTKRSWGALRRLVELLSTGGSAAQQHAAVQAARAGQQAEEQQEDVEEGEQQDADEPADAAQRRHRSGPRVMCSRSGLSGRLTAEAMSTRSRPTGDSHRTPMPEPVSSSSPKSSKALPVSTNIAK